MVAYLIKNALNGKAYIGIARRGVARRWAEHTQDSRRASKQALYCAIRKYGIGAFSIQPLASPLTPEALFDLEKLLITQFKTKAPFGYNLTDGGDGVAGVSAEIRELMSKVMTGRKHTLETRRKISEAGRRRVCSASQKEKTGNAMRGRKLSLEHRMKLSLAKIGKKRIPRTAQHSKRISEGLALAWARKRAL